MNMTRNRRRMLAFSRCMLVAVFFLALAGSVLADYSESNASQAMIRAAELDALAKMASERLRSMDSKLVMGGRVARIPELEAWTDPLGHSQMEAGRGREVTSDWTPYVGPFDLAEAAHLLKRTVIGPQFSEMLGAETVGLGTSVQNLLLTELAPAPPADWATEAIPDVSDWTQEMIDSLVQEYGQRNEMLRLWWAEVIIEEGGGISASPTLRESMTHFWHDHFATGARDVLFPQSMYVQNQLLREHALGNFKELVGEIYKDPAMLLWLNGQENYVGHINENFARELLELFTLGLDQYEQGDIVAAARSFTGWFTLDGMTSVYYPEYHDGGIKIFLNHAGNWEGDDIVDFIFEEDETARFICRKLYRWFIDEYPDEVLIEDLAATMRANNYEVAPVLERMLLSEHFFDSTYRGSIICDGVDKSIGLLRSLYMEDLNLMDGWGDEPAGPSIWTWYSMFSFGHLLLDPPNVAGWPGYRSWINATTLTSRKALDASVIDGNYYGYDLEMQADAIAIALETTDPNDPYQLVDDLALSFFGMPPTEAVRQRMLDELLQGSEPWEWSIYNAGAEAQVRLLLKLIFRLPDFQAR